MDLLKFRFHLINGEKSSLRENSIKNKTKRGEGGQHHDPCRLNGKRQEIMKHAAANQHASRVLP